MAPLVDVGVVTWNSAALTATALRALMDSDQGVEFRLLVHDNASADGTPEAIAAAVPEAEIEVGDENLGFGRAMNRLMARSDAPWFLPLNSDAWPEDGALRRLLDDAEAHPRCAAVAPLLLRPDGSVEHSTHPFPSVPVALVDVVGGRRWLPRRLQERLCLQGAWHHDRAREVDWAVGAALLMRRSALEEIGGFDERYFMYVEDLDWCWRAWRHGWTVRFQPAAVVRHVGDVSGKRRWGSTRAALESTYLDDFYRRARGPLRAATYRAANVAAAGLAMRRARRRDDAGEAAYWRTVLRAHAGRDVAPPTTEPTGAAAVEQGRG